MTKGERDLAVVIVVAFLFVGAGAVVVARKLRRYRYVWYYPIRGFGTPIPFWVGEGEESNLPFALDGGVYRVNESDSGMSETKIEDWDRFWAGGYPAKASKVVAYD